MKTILIVVLLLFVAVASLILCLSDIEIEIGPIKKDDKKK